MYEIAIAEAFATQLQRHAPGGQQSSCEAGGATGGASCIDAISSWQGAAAPCPATASAAMRVFANAATVPFANKARHNRMRSRQGNGRMATG